jgi:hypothetical protein
VPVLREIIEHEDFRRSVEELEIDPKRLDQVLFGITWTIARKPEFYPRVKGTASLRRVAIPPALHLPRLRLWFDHTDEQARLLKLEADPKDDG